MTVESAKRICTRRVKEGKELSCNRASPRALSSVLSVRCTASSVSVSMSVGTRAQARVLVICGELYLHKRKDSSFPVKKRGKK